MNMTEHTELQTASEQADAAAIRKPYTAPELMLRGDLTDVTAGAFGSFSP